MIVFFSILRSVMSQTCHLILDASLPRRSLSRSLLLDKSRATQGMLDLCRIVRIHAPMQPPAPVTITGLSKLLFLINKSSVKKSRLIICPPYRIIH